MLKRSKKLSLVLIVVLVFSFVFTALADYPPEFVMPTGMADFFSIDNDGVITVTNITAQSVNPSINYVPSKIEENYCLTFEVLPCEKNDQSFTVGIASKNDSWVFGAFLKIVTANDAISFEMHEYAGNTFNAITLENQPTINKDEYATVKIVRFDGKYSIFINDQQIISGFEPTEDTDLICFGGNFYESGIATMSFKNVEYRAATEEDLPKEEEPASSAPESSSPVSSEAQSSTAVSIIDNDNDKTENDMLPFIIIGAVLAVIVIAVVIFLILKGKKKKA